MLEHGSEVSLKIVLKNKNANEIRIPRGAKNVPGKRHHAECADSNGMHQSKSSSPVGGSERPKSNCSCGE